MLLSFKLLEIDVDGEKEEEKEEEKEDCGQEQIGVDDVDGL